MAATRTYIAFPYLVFENLRKLDEVYFKTFNYHSQYCKDFRFIARCISYHIGKGVETFSYLPICLDPNHPEVPDRLHRKLMLLRFLSLAESKYLNYEDIKYLAFGARDDLIVGNGPYLFGLENNDKDKRFFAYPIDCRRIPNVPATKINLSDKAKKLLLSSAYSDNKLFNAIVCYIASYFGAESENYASQVINLEAGFECFIGLKKEEGKPKFAEKVASYYDDNVTIRDWALEFYELRSRIHHGFESKEGKAIKKPDYRWRHPKSIFETRKMVTYGRKIFYDIVRNHYLGEKINANILEKELRPNSLRFGRMISILREKRQPDREFRILVEELDPNDHKAPRTQLRKLARLCLEFLSGIDQSFSGISAKLKEVFLQDRIGYYSALFGFEEVMKGCERLRTSVGSVISAQNDPAIYPHKANVDAVLDLLYCLGKTGIYMEKQHETRPRNKQ